MLQFKDTFKNFAATKFENRVFVIDDGWQFVTHMIGPQEDNSSSLRIIDTAVRSVKIVYIIFYMDILIIGGRNTARLWNLICQQKIW